ncbi:MAG: response regulator [Pseudomonadota bacterium]|nr:MAG: response regulator [Pseudomonadota bacterium]
MSPSSTSHQSLQWTRPLLDELCQDIRQTVEEWSDPDAEPSNDGLDSAIDAARRMAGSLSVLEFQSGEMLGEAIASVLEAVQGDDNFARKDEAINAVMEATAVVPDYLDYLENTQRDAPVVLLATINNLRAVVNAEPLDEARFFQPPLDAAELPDHDGDGHEPNALRRSYQKALSGFLVNNGDSEALEAISDVAFKLRDQASLPASVRRVGWAAGAVSDSLAQGQLESGPAMARLYARLDALLKQLLDDAPGIDDAADALCRSFLFQIAVARPDNDQARAVHKAFDLVRHAPENATEARVFLAGRNRALFAAVTAAAREDLAQIKDTLGSQLERAADPDVLKQQTELLESVGQSLAMLGLDTLSERIKAQASQLSELGSDPDDPTLLGVARELLVVESQLEENFGINDVSDSEIESADDATLLPASEKRRVMRQLFHEAGEDLAHAKSLLDAVNRGKADANAAQEAHARLERISHALDMAMLPDGANMIEGARRLVASQLLDGQTSPRSDHLEALAQALTVAEFYLESQTRLDDKGQEYFDNTREQLEQFGYWPSDEVAPVEAPEPAEDMAEAEGTTEDLEDDFTSELEPAESTLAPEEQPASLDETLEPDETPADSPAPADESGAGFSFEDFDITEIFLEEFDQETETLQEMLPQWRQEPDNNDVQTTIRRAFHSLKGSGRMAGAEEIGEFSWQIEHLMNRVLDGQLRPAEDVIELVEQAVTVLPSMRARLSGEGDEAHDEAHCAELARRAERLAAGEESEAAVRAAGGAEVEGLDPTLIELMIKELSENLEPLDEWVAAAVERDASGRIDDRLVRAVHTMKGTMRMAPIGDETDTAQIFEQYLEELAHTGELPGDDGLVVIMDCQRLFRKRLERLQGDEIADGEFNTAELSAELRRLHELAHRDYGAEISETRYPEEADEPVFSSDADDLAEVSTDDADVFDIEADVSEAESSAEAETAETAEAEEAEAEEAEAEEAEAEEAEAEEAEAEAAEAEAAEAEEAEAEEAEAEEAEAEEAEAEEAEAEAAEAEEAEAEEAEAEEAEAEAAEAEEAEAEAAEAEAAEAQEVEAEGAETEFRVEYAQLNEELLEAFLEEAEEVLEHADESLQRWREAPDDRGLVTGLQRDLHTIKGSSRMVGLDPIGSIAHVMEEMLEGIAAGLQQPSTDRINALESGCDHLHAMVDAVEKREPLPRRSIDDVFREQAEAIEEAEILPELAAEPEAAEETETQVVRTETLRVPAELVDDLVNYAGEISIFRSRLEEQVMVFRTNVAEVDETVIRLRDQLRKLEIETEAQILARYEREHGPADETFDPLELDRYSTIQQLSRALGESVNDLTSLTGMLDDATRQSETLLMQQSRVNTELQEGLMQARMIAFNTLLPRFRRVVRNASRDVGKQAQLRVSIEGEGELDRSVLDRITAPLEHLLRNAISHGIEPPEQRRKAGKSETGTIHVDVSREATDLVVRVNDDGGGLDYEAIRQRGIEQNLIGKDDEVGERELAQLIFRPGFSTAREVSELAGRGIGMDVVASEVRQIGGSVSAASQPGQGARFTIRIPLSLTVMQAIMVRVADRQFAIPLQAVRGVTRMLANEWRHQIQTSDPHQEYAGERFPLMELETQLGFDAEDVPDGTLSLLMIEAGEQRAAMRVSELHGHREIVIKPVGPQISSITGILGGTITGDGRVIPILDMGPLIRNAFERNLLPGQEVEVHKPEAADEAKRTPLVMVVDDSITMRRVTSRVLEHRGLEVITARDGLDAVEAMFDRIPDLILLDIEMPRMDGYELASHVRNDPRLKHVPMVMITSRSGEKHRQHARELGVNGYLTKPYQETDLIEEVFEKLKMAVPEG